MSLAASWSWPRRPGASCRWPSSSSQAKSITDLAEQEGVTDAYVCRLLPLTCLAPDIVEAILDGRQRPEVTLDRLLRPFPVEWDGQPTLASGSQIPVF